MSYGARDFANELRIGAWNTADDKPIFPPEGTEVYGDVYGWRRAAEQVEHVLNADPAALLAEEDSWLTLAEGAAADSIHEHDRDLPDYEQRRDERIAGYAAFILDCPELHALSPNGQLRWRQGPNLYWCEKCQCRVGRYLG